MCILRVFNHYSSAPKNEDAYEISIPFEDNNFEQQGGFYNQNDQNFDGQFSRVSLLFVSCDPLCTCPLTVHAKYDNYTNKYLI